MPLEERAIQKLTDKPYLAVLATIYPSGTPQVFPVWYEYDGSHFLVVTAVNAVKVRNLKRNPQVALCITDTSRHSETLTVRGKAELVFDNRLAHEVGDRMGIKYLGPKNGEAYNHSVANEEFVLIRIAPERYIWSE